jgi:glycosyltransferase involved in cell wall biosynthesis
MHPERHRTTVHDQIRVALVADYLEECWPSMDLVACMLMGELSARHRGRVVASLLRPRFVRRFSRPGVGGERKYLLNADRLLNRFIDYPRFVRSRRNDFDVFHIVDHSYSHLAAAVGTERCVVTCHDVDAFRYIVGSYRGARSIAYAAMAKRILRGLRAAAAIACDSAATRDEVLRYHIAPAERLSVNPNGVADIFTTRPDPCADAEVRRILGPPPRDQVEIVHVGSTIPRKRIDVLLRVATTLQRIMPSVRVVRVGGAFTPSQRKLVDDMELSANAVSVLPFVSAEVLAAVYRRAVITLLPSESEGFGLPVLESLACGTPVVLSDITVLREVGGPAATFCPVADVERWTEAILGLIEERQSKPQTWTERSVVGSKWASRFTWRDHADRAIQLYETVAPSH